MIVLLCSVLLPSHGGALEGGRVLAFIGGPMAQYTLKLHGKERDIASFTATGHFQDNTLNTHHLSPQSQGRGSHNSLLTLP
jgi:hypothetical protein